MRVLIVDDEEDVRDVARLSLGHVGGMDVIEASDGFQAVAKAADEQPDFVLLDVMMPGMDGPATFAALHADPRTAHIPVVFLTAKAMPSELARLKELGAAGVIMKPFDPMTLAKEARGILGR